MSLPPWFRSVCRSILLCVCAAAPAASQYRFDHWTTENGLPQNIVIGLHQTPEGYLWIATLDGLARFDGVRFTVFNKSNTPGIGSNRFYCLYGDPSGDLWLGTEIGTVTRYHEGRFVTYGAEHGLPGNGVTLMTGDAKGRVWALSNRRVWEWEPAAQRFAARATPQFSTTPRLLQWNQPRGFWGVNADGLQVFTAGAWRRVKLPASLTVVPLEVFQADDEVVWFEGRDRRLYHLRNGTATAFQIPASEEWRDSRGRGWNIEIGPGGIRALRLPSSEPWTLPPFEALYEDREGNLWMGATNQGLYRIRPATVTSISQEQGLAGRNVYPIYEDRAGAIWVGGWSGAGLSRIQAGKITTFTARDGLAKGVVTSLGEDRDGRLWVATEQDLQAYERGRFTSIKAAVSAGRPGGAALFQDRAGAMWVGTSTGLIRHRNGRSEQYTRKDGLPGDAAHAIIDAADGGVWIGFYEGLAHWRDGRIRAWTERDGLPGNMVRSLYEDAEGTLWIGTYDSGLGRFKDGAFTRYTTRDGLFNDGVFRILEDDAGNLWMSCNRGIYRVRKQDLNDFAAGRRRNIVSMAFGKGDGMRNAECNGGLWPAGIRARDGRLWFPTQDGVAVIDPAAIRTNPHPPPVVIEDVRIDNRPVGLDARNGIEIGPQEASFDVQYTALSFINPESIRFKYKLEGLDEYWIDAGTRRTAYFSHVAPGTYTFKVIAANSDDVWNLEGRSLRIAILPPFYRTRWFPPLASLAVLGLAIAGYVARVRQLKRRYARQQAFSDQLIASQEAERARIAAEMHDSLGQHLLVIKNWAMIGLNLAPHAAAEREPLTEISSAASQAIEEVRDVIYDLRPYQLDKIGLTNTLRFMIEKVASVSGIAFRAELDDVDEVFPHERQVTFYRIVQECLNNIVKHSRATTARVSVRRSVHALYLTVEDNGRGFAAVEAGAASASPASGFGLTGLRERVRLLGGREIIHSAPGQGTRILIAIDLV